MRTYLVKNHFIKLVFPVLLGLSTLFGGSSLTELTSRHWLSLLSLLILFLSLPFAVHRSWNRPASAGAALFVAWLTWSIIQTIPLPASIWRNLGDRAVVERGLELFGMETTHFMPITLAPNATWLSLMGVLPAVATFMIIVAMGWRRALSRIDWTIPILGAASALLGFAQILGGERNELYLYDFTNRGLPVGVFANVNHQACFLLMCLPFVAALIGQLRRNWTSGDDDYAKAFMLGTLAALTIVGILAAGSVAGYAMLPPVLVLSTLVAGQPRTSGRVSVATPAIVVTSMLMAVLLVAFSPVLDGLGITSFDVSEMSRLGVWEVSREIASDHWLAGTGPGSFADVYRLYENPDAVTPQFVNHAHNDYFQAIIEFGLPGILALFGGVVLVVILFVNVWTSHKVKHKRLKRAAATALLVVLMHSFVDYPARTPAIASLAVACFAILVLSEESRNQYRRKKIKRPDSFGEDDSRRRVI